MCPRLGTRLSAQQMALTWAHGPVTNCRAEVMIFRATLCYSSCSTELSSLSFVFLCFCFLFVTSRSFFVKSVATIFVAISSEFSCVPMNGSCSIYSIIVLEVEIESTFYQRYSYLSFSLGRQSSLFCFLIHELYSLQQLRHTAKLSRKWDRPIPPPHRLHIRTTSPTITFPHHSGMFVTTQEPMLIHRYHSTSLVYTRVHLWSCTVYRFWQMHNDMDPPL